MHLKSVSFFAIIDKICVTLIIFGGLNSYTVRTRNYVEPTSITSKKTAKQWPTPIEISRPADVVSRHAIACSKGKTIGNSFRLLDLFVLFWPRNVLQLTISIFYRHRAASCYGNSAAIAALFAVGEWETRRI